MARFDAKQFEPKRRLALKECPKNLPSPDAYGIKSVSVKGWYLRLSQKIMIRVKIELARTHNGRIVSTRWEEDWPGGGDPARLNRHVQAMANKYYKKIRSGEWPEEKNYLTHCNPRHRPGFQASICPGCTARYCTVER